MASYERALWRREAAQLGTFIGPEEMAAIHAMMPTWEDVVAPPGAVPVDVRDGTVPWRGERRPLALERGPPALQQGVAVLLLPLAFAADLVLSPSTWGSTSRSAEWCARRLRATMLAAAARAGSK
ncbi:MAG: hypothetical protein M9894_05985 [Planctomycetes bacterium]|nr:hypothetical protein [Planctomycetota bacterium]